MQIKFNFNNYARVCHCLAACQRHTPSSLAAVIGLSNNDVISLRSLRVTFRTLRALRALCWLEIFQCLVLGLLSNSVLNFIKIRL